MRYLSKSVLVAFLLAAINTLADTGVLKIKVSDANSNALADAVVEAKTSESLTTRKGVTDALGEVRLVGLDPSSKYQIVISKVGYQTLKNNNVLVVTGKSFSLNYTLRDAGVDIEEVTVVGRQVQLIDSTSAIVSQDITLDLTESLPTGRDYQSYLQLAPGTKPSSGGNPSSKSGVNYSDAVDRNGNTSGVSTDNLYYIDNINVTDNFDGVFGANFNSEIIQEQHVITGGVPAEMEGGTGLISRVVTKSGSNEFHGSINYYLQNDSLVANNKNIGGNSFSTFDTAFTLGGPIIKDKLWFFTSYQIKEREDDVVSALTGEKLRSVSTDQTLGFAKLTWQPTDSDKFIVSFFNDPNDRDGSDDSSVLTNRDNAREQGGDNYKIEYSHAWESVILTLEAASHEGESTTISADKSTRNDVAYLDYNPTEAQTDIGGFGSDTIESRNRDTYAVTLQYFLDTAWGSHDIKVGYSFTKNERLRDFSYTGEGSQYTSIANRNSGTTMDSYVNGDWTGTTDIVEENYPRIINAMKQSSDSDLYNELLDADNNGIIDNDELAMLQFSSTQGNPGGFVNVYRINMVQTAPVSFETEGTSFFVQDSWTYENWTISAGIRVEEWEHFATDGTSIFTFDADIAPRFSVVYDLSGEIESKVWGFYGRYYDPIRTDMTSFAGSLTGPVLEEQIYIGDRWLTFRTRGGRQEQDAFFAPTTKTPYTDEFMLGYSQSIAEDMSVDITYTKRVTKDLLEDYDLGLYTDSSANGVGGYSLPLSYFGYESTPDSNFVIATLEGGKREYQGVELAFRKRRTDNWQMLASYTYNWAKGNSNSDGNADFQGDVVWLDPRAPGMWGDQPGNIDHLFKVAGSYFWNNGIEVGFVYNWNSGIKYSETFSASGRHLPSRVDVPYESRGVTGRWVNENAVGSRQADSYGTLDLRLKYVLDIKDYTTEFFVDVFNVFDDQAVVREQDLLTGDGTFNFGEAVEWVDPRRFYLGARVSF